MRLIVWVTVSLAGLVALFFGAVVTYPEIAEKVIEKTCSMTVPNEGCRRRMIAMGHIWSLKGKLGRARPWYARVANLGEPVAMFHLAWTYQKQGYEGLVVSGGGADYIPLKNNGLDLAMDWYRNAADKGFAPAMNNLGELYLFGPDRDVRAAFNWHLLAAHAGNPVAAINVSLAYRIGLGVQMDIAAARKWAAAIPKNNSMDLRDTTLYGSPIDAHMRSVIRNAAARGEAVAVDFAPLKPSAGLSTFHKVTSSLDKTPPSPTLRQLRP
jgi:hypothetical protein